mmetsp:Transcript_59578/g.138761  ORF Transcript_59578/g.138761 Transcript_59578/m.138761 type:complete len:208 (+) Transcript_59578:1272-1895(+)
MSKPPRRALTGSQKRHGSQRSTKSPRRAKSQRMANHVIGLSPKPCVRLRHQKSPASRRRHVQLTRSRSVWRLSGQERRTCRAAIANGAQVLAAPHLLLWPHTCRVIVAVIAQLWQCMLTSALRSGCAVQNETAMEDTLLQRLVAAAAVVGPVNAVLATAMATAVGISPATHSPLHQSPLAPLLSTTARAPPVAAARPHVCIRSSCVP